jgi:hypothetical protein
VLSDRITQILPRGGACPELVEGCPHLPSVARLRNVLSLSLAVLLALTSFSFAQKPKTPNPLAPKPQAAARPAELPPTGAHELTAADLEAFLDGAWFL